MHGFGMHWEQKTHYSSMTLGSQLQRVQQWENFMGNVHTNVRLHLN